MESCSPQLSPCGNVCFGTQFIQLSPGAELVCSTSLWGKTGHRPQSVTAGGKPGGFPGVAVPIALTEDCRRQLWSKNRNWGKKVNNVINKINKVNKVITSGLSVFSFFHLCYLPFCTITRSQVLVPTVWEEMVGSSAFPILRTLRHTWQCIFLNVIVEHAGF